MSQANVVLFKQPVASLDALIVKAVALPPAQLHMIDEIKRVMHAELLCAPLEGADPWLLELLAVQAHQVVIGRVARPFVASEWVTRRNFFGTHHAAERVLCSDGCFRDIADSGVVVARFPTMFAAEAAGYLALNRRDDAVVCVTTRPYLQK